jgi:benzoyl-CoA reductase/2-hydroxyglutaryl-CoA dehydratase subunit BcrC/BadD/HgdB
MSECGNQHTEEPRSGSAGCPEVSASRKSASPQAGPEHGPLAWFGNMIQNCHQYAVDAKAAGKHIVGIMCEYTPRELIMAADGVPVCLCGGSAEMISPAEEHLPANLCPLIKSTYGYSVKQANPFLAMTELLVAETTCDGKKKMYELLAETKPMYVLELPQKQADSDAFDHWVKELRKFRADLERRFGVEVTDEKIRRAIGTMNRERRLRRELAGLMKSEHPPLTGRQLLAFKSIISGIEADLRQYAAARDL